MYSGDRNRGVADRPWGLIGLKRPEEGALLAVEAEALPPMRWVDRGRLEELVLFG